MSSISPKKIRKYRRELGLTQEQAAKIIYKSMRAWQQWEGGQRNMPLDSWELFLLKTKVK